MLFYSIYEPNYVSLLIKVLINPRKILGIEGAIPTGFSINDGPELEGATFHTAHSKSSKLSDIQQSNLINE